MSKIEYDKDGRVWMQDRYGNYYDLGYDDETTESDYESK